jgi:hypothetical protein
MEKSLGNASPGWTLFAIAVLAIRVTVGAQALTIYASSFQNGFASDSSTCTHVGLKLRIRVALPKYSLSS